MAGKISSTLFSCLSIIVFLHSCADYHLMPEEEKPQDPVLKIVEVTDTTATISWTKADVYDFTSYGIYYGGYTDIVDTTDTLYDSLLFRQDTTITIRGLRPSTGYSFRVITNTEHGESGISNIITFHTAESENKAPEPVFVTLIKISADTVNLSWTKCTEPDFERYVVYYDTVNTISTVDPGNAPGFGKQITDRNDTTTTIYEVSDSMQYWFTVFVVDGSDRYSASNVVTNR